MADFDATELPPSVASAFHEAAVCASVECYRAAGVMLRRTMEELCEDRGATGATLKDRLVALRSVVILPPDLLEATNDLRLLGNDATHVELKDFDSIGRAEIDAAMTLVREILKSVYQLQALRAQLAALKKKVP